MKKTISILPAVCMMAALLAGCGTLAPAASETRAAEPVQPVSAGRGLPESESLEQSG